MTELLAPNGKTSNLTAEQYKLVRTPAFIQWFGDWQNDPENASKVVDENGEPLVLNHTTKKYEKFDKIKQETIYGVYEDEFDVDNFMQEKGNYIFSTPKSSVNPIFLSRKGVYALSDDVWQVKFFANIKNLFDTDDKQDLKKLQDYTIKTYSQYGNFDNMSEDLYGGGYETFEVDYLIGNRKNKYDNNGSIPALISEMGYGGYINKDENVLVLFDKNNLKLSDGSNNTFDGSNPDIRFKGGGEIKYLKGKKTQIWNILKNHYLSEQEAEENEENYSRLNIFEDGDLADFAQVKAFDKNLYFDFDMLEKQIKEIAKNPSVTSIELEYGDYEKRVTDWLILYEKDKFNDGGEVIINPTEIECHKCHWHWKVKDGGDDLFICHKCYTDNSKYYKFEGLEGQKILDTISYAKGGRTISQTPAPKKDQIKGSDKNKEGSAKDTSSAKKIKFSNDVLEKIQNSVDKHNKKHPNKKITLDSAKAVVRRGMGAYSQTYRPTISGGKPNSRVAWGLARLNAFLYKIVNGKSKSGKYSQDNDLIEELGYKVAKYEIGGIFQGTPHNFNAYSTEYIGTGEGNQVFGWGLYFTDQKDIARYYMSAGLYEDEEKILLDGKSLSEYDVEQEVKDQLVGIVNTIFEEDKLIPTIPLIKDYLVLEYDEENYPEFKELVEQSTKTWNFIQDKKLTFRGNIYYVTLFKGKNPNQYDLLQWEEKPTENQILKIKNQAEKEGVDLSKLPFPLERYRDSNAIYTDLSRIISGVSHLDSRDSGKMCSNFLLRAGIDGIKYKAGTLSGFEGQEGYNYVIFNANDVTIEDVERYDEILAGKEKYADGGDIEAYEEAIGISEFDEGGEAKPKKVYVSIKLDNNLEKIPNTFNEYFTNYSEKTFEELKNGVLIGVVGVSSSPNNIAEWFISRDCLIVMNYDEFMAINETETINYYDPYQLMKNNLYLFKRLYANITRYGEQEGSYVFTQTLVKILEKMIREINLEMNLAEGQKYSELYRISRFLSPYETRAFPDWIEKNQIKIESPIDLTNAILDFNKLNDNWLGSGFPNSVLTFDELLPIVEKGITNASSVYDSEQEIVLNNRKLNVPKNSQLFFVGKDEVGNKRESNKDELIEKYNLKELYKVYFVNAKEIQKYRDFWLKKEEEKFNQKIETGKQDLEIKKRQVTDNLIDYFIQNSIDVVIDKVNREILSYESGSLEFYDSTKDDYEEINWVKIPLVDELFSKYTEIVIKSWKEIIESKGVSQVNLYSFNVFTDNAYREFKTYLEQNRDKYEELENYRNTKGRPSFNLGLLEYDLYKSLYDYENLPEWIDYKELSKMYLYKMGVEIYRYYDKKDLPLISYYNNGGETNELNLIQNNTMNTNNPKDTITMNIPLLIRYSELMREDIKTDVALHEVIENLLDIKDKGVLTMDDYESVIGNVTGTSSCVSWHTLEVDVNDFCVFFWKTT